MRRPIKHVLVAVTSAAIAAASLQAPVSAAPASEPAPPSEVGGAQRDDLPHPLGDKQRAMRQEAVERVLKGKARKEQRGNSEVVKLAPGQYVEYGVEKTDRIFTILSEFGDQIHPTAGGTPGPRAGQIAEPDRDWDGGPTDDNSTYWKPVFDRQHYMDLFFEGSGDTMADFYRKQSGGRYNLTGDVSDWVRLPYNEARYGSNRMSSASTYWVYVRDTVTAWYEAERAAGKTDAQIAEYLKQFDNWDRYDHDSDGNFDEPDGYVDHFQAIHAGEGEEAGGGAQGSDAIWSHRWYAYSNGIGSTGPEGNRLGGVPIGSTGIWVGDYTTEPENGGLGVFVHEYGHDLGLPDLYDTSGGDNGTGFWTVMSTGSWMNRGGDAIGTTPNYMGAWEKLQLGWLDHEVVEFGDDTTTELGVAAQPGKQAQALAVMLPDQVIRTEYNTPHSGSYEWWGGSADNLNTTLTRTLDLTGATTASVTAKAWYDIEAGYDYVYGEVSTDGGTTWTRVGTPLDGDSNGQWTDLTYDLTAFAGRTVEFRYRYQTDGGVHLAGAFLDDISLVVDGATAWTDDVEAGTGAWTADGWSRMTGATERTAARYYLAENRQYVGYDETLRVGPYNFGWSSTKPDWVERFPYQNGLLVWYVNEAYTNNNTRQHPGHGLALPVDARPEPVKFADGVRLGNRRQPFDATFGLEATDAVTFHRNGVPVTVPSQPAIRRFDDSDPNRYWSAENPWSSVKVAGTGTSISVLGQSRGGAMLVVDVDFRD